MNYWALFCSILVSVIALISGGVLAIGMGVLDGMKDLIGWCFGLAGWAAIVTADVWLIAHV